MNLTAHSSVKAGPCLDAQAPLAPGLLLALAALLPELPDGKICSCAYSGGLDSSALLAACALRYGPARVYALHINHGLSDANDAFETFCTSRAHALGVPFMALRVDGRARPGQSPEEAARAARYPALAQSSQALGAAFCLLAQHATDQAETLLLALARGLGLPGLSGMGSWRQDSAALFHRPWLAVSRERILSAATEAGLLWTEDPTNAEERFLRNKIRTRFMPALLDALPDFERSAARSMAHCAQAQELLDEIAQHDMLAHHDMDILGLRTLSRPRLVNLLRAWAQTSDLGPPSSSQLDEALLQIAATALGGALDIRFGQGRLLRDGGCLRAQSPPKLS